MLVKRLNMIPSVNMSAFILVGAARVWQVPGPRWPHPGSPVFGVAMLEVQWSIRDSLSIRLYHTPDNLILSR